MKANSPRRTWWLISACVLAVPAISAGTSLSGQAFLPGVSSAGNLEMDLGGRGAQKSYVEPNSGIVIQFTSGVVTNRSGRSARFLDTGTTLRNPLNGTMQTAVSDQVSIGAPLRSFSHAGARNSSQAKAEMIAVFTPTAGAEENSTQRCFMSRAEDGTISCTCTEEFNP